MFCFETSQIKHLSNYKLKLNISIGNWRNAHWVLPINNVGYKPDKEGQLLKNTNASLSPPLLACRTESRYLWLMLFNALSPKQNHQPIYILASEGEQSFATLKMPFLGYLLFQADYFWKQKMQKRLLTLSYLPEGTQIFKKKICSRKGDHLSIVWTKYGIQEGT